MNLRLFFLLIIINSLCVLAGLFALILFFFFYFGSGASSSSEKAILIQNIFLGILVILPLLFGIFKYKTLPEKTRAKSYFYAGLLVTIIIGIYLVHES